MESAIRTAAAASIVTDCVSYVRFDSDQMHEVLIRFIFFCFGRLLGDFTVIFL